MALFEGANPAEVKRLLNLQGKKEDMALAQMAPGRGMVAGASGAGRMLGGAIQGMAGVEDPAVEKSKRMQQAQQDTMMQAQEAGMDLQSNPHGYYDLAIKNLNKYGLGQEAAAAAKDKEGFERFEVEQRGGGREYGRNILTGERKSLSGFDPARTASARDRARKARINVKPSGPQIKKVVADQIDQDKDLEGMKEDQKFAMGHAVASRENELLRDNPEMNADQARERAFEEVKELQTSPAYDAPFFSMEFDQPASFTAKRNVEVARQGNILKSLKEGQVRTVDGVKYRKKNGKLQVAK